MALGIDFVDLTGDNVGLFGNREGVAGGHPLLIF
jgi:hypothetical protein